jgi:hypothetical protein
MMARYTFEQKQSSIELAGDSAPFAVNDSEHRFAYNSSIWRNRRLPRG